MSERALSKSVMVAAVMIPSTVKVNYPLPFRQEKIDRRTALIGYYSYLRFGRPRLLGTLSVGGTNSSCTSTPSAFAARARVISVRFFCPDSMLRQ